MAPAVMKDHAKEYTALPLLWSLLVNNLFILDNIAF